MQFSAWIMGAAIVAGVGTTTSGVSVKDDYAQKIDTVRQQRVARLTSPSGWLTLVGLDWLKEGKNTVGSAKDNAIVLAGALQ